MNCKRSGDEESPFKKGPIREVVNRVKKRPRWRRSNSTSKKDATTALYTDLVQVLANNGITLSRVYTIAAELIKRGWVKQRKIELSTEE